MNLVRICFSRQMQPDRSTIFLNKLMIDDMYNSVSNVVEFLRAGLGRLRTINSELNGAN